MSPDHEQFVLQLFDSLWFKNRVTSNGSRRSNSSTEVVQAEMDEAAAVPTSLYRTPSAIGRSVSDQALSSKDINQSDSDSPTPTSVLQMRPTLETILSGKEVGDDQFAQAMNTDCGDRGIAAEKTVIEKRNSRSRGGRRRRRRNNGNSRSLSELEYQELKGFMDLGFVFSDEDKDSSLVCIIPGLQRLGTNKDDQSSSSNNNNNNNNNGVGGFLNSVSSSSSVRRPYLSEAWDVEEMEKAVKPLVNWRIPAFGNEVELKHHLKSWAQTVASTVR